MERYKDGIETTGLLIGQGKCHQASSRIHYALFAIALATLLVFDVQFHKHFRYRVSR